MGNYSVHQLYKPTSIRSTSFLLFPCNISKEGPVLLHAVKAVYIFLRYQVLFLVSATCIFNLFVFTHSFKLPQVSFILKKQSLSFSFIFPLVVPSLFFLFSAEIPEGILQSLTPLLTSYLLQCCASNSTKEMFLLLNHSC